MALKSTMIYTATSLEDIAEHFDSMAKSAEALAVSYRKGTKEHIASGQAFAWREAATFLRNVRLEEDE
jgi:hypothetical protein